MSDSVTCLHSLEINTGSINPIDRLLNMCTTRVSQSLTGSRLSLVLLRKSIEHGFCLTKESRCCKGDVRKWPPNSFI